MLASFAAGRSLVAAAIALVTFLGHLPTGRRGRQGIARQPWRSLPFPPDFGYGDMSCFGTRRHEADSGTEIRWFCAKKEAEEFLEWLEARGSLHGPVCYSPDKGFGITSA